VLFGRQKKVKDLRLTHGQNLKSFLGLRELHLACHGKFSDHDSCSSQIFILHKPFDCSGSLTGEEQKNATRLSMAVVFDSVNGQLHE
jgi:hypothetical protein